MDKVVKTRAKRCACGQVLRAQASKDSGKCGTCRGVPGCELRNRPGTRKRKVGVPRVLFPGDRLMAGQNCKGFVWEVDGDRIEVRSYEGRNAFEPQIKIMTRAEVCFYQIDPNDSYGVDRPVYRERARA